MQNELNSPASGEGVDDAEEIGDELLAVGLAAVTVRSTVAPHGGRWTTCHGRAVAGNTPPSGGPLRHTETNRLTRGPAWTCWVIPRIWSGQHTHRAGYGGHTTSMPIEDMLETPTWIAIAHRGPSLSVQETPARGLGPAARVASAYVTAVRTTAASRCRRIAWYEVAGSTPRL
jgi:hypothetical protein